MVLYHATTDNMRRMFITHWCNYTRLWETLTPHRGMVQSTKWMSNYER